MLSAAARSAIEDALGAVIQDLRPVSGGDINESLAASLRDGRRVFIKVNSRADAAMFPAEARGLQWLRGGSLRVPEVLAVSDDPIKVPVSAHGSHLVTTWRGGRVPDNQRAGSASFLVLELLEPGRRIADFDEQLGRGLAQLHQRRPASFGLGHDNFIAVLPQDNTPQDSWSEFYATRRLEPQLRMAAERGRATAAMRKGFEHLFREMSNLVGPEEPPARLHGDLWGGNLHVDADGRPCLIDPAVYGGHREIDLAMMRLFGGFGARCFEAYDEAYPLSAGHAERVELYQLYPLMVHVNLFGGGYGRSVERIVRRYTQATR